MTETQFNEIKALLVEVSAKLDKLNKLEQVVANTKPPHPIYQVFERIGLGVTIGGLIFIAERLIAFIRG